MPEMLIPKKLQKIIGAKQRFIVLFGGRGSSKSMSVADIVLMRAQTEKAKVGCFREFQNSIEDSVHSLLESEINRLGIAGFECQSSKILYENEDAFTFKGLARNIQSVKSMHGYKIFWIEEGQTISFNSLKELTPTLRAEGSQIYITANLQSRADPLSQRFFVPYEKELLKNGYYEDELHLIIWINYTDNPFFPDVLEQERAFDEQNLSRALYNHIWLGHTYDEVDNSIIPVDWFDAAIDAHKKLGFKGEGALIASFDPSDEGADAKGYALRHGSVILDVSELDTGDSADGIDWALNKAITGGADWFVWDGDGLGIALKREVERGLQGKQMDYVMFRGSQEPENPNEPYEPTDSYEKTKRKTNKETFLNRRAQYYWRLRDKFFNTYKAVVKGEYVNPGDMISLSSEIDCLDQLRAEVCRIPLKRNNNGKIQIMSKLEMSKKPYELPSPNMADALMMGCFAPSKKQKTVSINFEGWQ